MEIAFTKCSPTQNVTILVESAVPRPEQPAAAARLLAYDNVGGEQVGFLEPTTLSGARLRLQMMGGEFCGNATMSAGAFLAMRDHLPDGSCADYPLEVSGAEGLTICHIERIGDAFRGTVRMPLPRRIDVVSLETDAGALTFPRIEMPGITHIVTPMQMLSREETARRIRGWNQHIRADALGLLRYDQTECHIEPLVYVPATDSAVWERGCGSGTAALGSLLAQQLGRSTRASVRQPGGEIEVHAEVEAGRVARLSIAGTVRITVQGVAFI